MIRVDGARIPPPRRHRYLALNKPRGVVATMDDPEGRRTIADLLRQGAGRRSQRAAVPRRSAGHRQRGFVDLDQRRRLRPTRLAHPSYEVPKTYVAEVAGVVSPQTLQAIAAAASRWRTVRCGRRRSRSFPARETRPLSRSHCRRVGIASCAVRWRRSAIRCVGCRGPASDRSGSGNLKVGEYRELTRDELGELLDLTGG